MKWEPCENSRVTGIESVVVGKGGLAGEEKDMYVIPIGVRVAEVDKEYVVSIPLFLAERPTPEDMAKTFELALQASLMTLKAFVEHQQK